MSKRWIPGALLCGWLGFTSATTAQSPLPAGPVTPTEPAATVAAPQASAGATPAQEIASTATPGLATVGYNGYPVAMPAPMMPPCEPGPSDGIAVTAFEPEAICGRCGCPFTIRFEYLSYWTKNRGLPLLVTSGSSTDGLPGAENQPTTAQLVGGALPNLNDGSSARSRAFDANNHIGYRIGVGTWLDGAETIGLDLSFFQLLQRNAHKTVTTEQINSGPNVFPVVLARPFINLTQNRFDSVVVGPAGTFASVETNLDRMLYGGEANLRFVSPHSVYSLGRCGILAGARYLSLQTGLEINQRVETLTGLPGPRPNTVLNEVFDARTQFYGGQMGLEYELRFGGWVVNATGKLALGASQEKLTLFAGSTTRNAQNQVTANSINNGVLIRPSNAGSYKDVEFSYVADAGLTLGYEFNQWVRVNIGYNFLYWDKVLEPEDQIDRSVNTGANRAPSATNPNARPTVSLKADDFYMQGLSAGLQFSW